MYYSRNILGHKKDDKQRASNLFFISQYFRTIIRIFYKIELFTEDIANIKEFSDRQKIIDYIDEIFVNAEINKNVISMVENIFEQIFDDSTIIEIISDNLPRFLKTTIKSEKVVKIVNAKIESKISKKDCITLIDNINKLFI